jgi:hypothetical protein
MRISAATPQLLAEQRDRLVQAAVWSARVGNAA